jgi:hypothetical protein
VAIVFIETKELNKQVTIKQEEQHLSILINILLTQAYHEQNQKEFL